MTKACSLLSSSKIISYDDEYRNAFNTINAKNKEKFLFVDTNKRA